MKLALLVLMLSSIALFSQTSTPWLDPDNFPKTLACDTTGLVLPYYEYCHGTKFYEVRPTPGGATPVIDGLLENNIWAYAETLLVNSWEDAGRSASCDDKSRKFNGPKDFHAIWRFCYNAEGLYVGIEIHDDKWNYGGVKSWNGQDCIEMAVDPWDWGCAATGGAQNCDWGKNIFRRYWSNNAQIIPYNDDAHKAFVRLIKRAVDEPYLVGLIKGTLKNNYTPGEEGTNFVRGSNDLRGIDFRTQYAGTDRWGRAVIHFEFKFPFHTTLWDMLDNNGFYDNGLPKSGNLFKMNFTNDDDDGSEGGNSFLRTRNFGLSDGFVDYDCHWSDTRYMMVFKYSSRSAREVVPPYPATSGTVVLHGHPSIADIWEDSANTYYDFTKGGTVIINDTSYFYDSTVNNSFAGAFTTIEGSLQTGNYTFKHGRDAANSLQDTLSITRTGRGTIKLLRRFVTGLDLAEGRWVKASMSVRSRGNECTVYDSIWTPVPGAREFRFCPLSKINKTLVTNPEYQNCVDSVRIYNYGSDNPNVCYTYDDKRVLRGRDSVLYDFEIKKIVRATSAPRNMIVTSRLTGAIDTLAEILPFPLLNVGESGVDAGGTQINQRQKRMNSTNPADSILKLQVIDKYTNSMMFFPDSPGVPLNGLLYRDNVVLINDNSNPRYWSKLGNGWIILDTNYLVDYDSTAKTANGGILPKSPDSLVFPDSSWLQQVCTFVIEAKAGEKDTFVFRDTTHIKYADYHYDVGSLRNTIDTMKCRSISVEKVSDETLAKVLDVEKYPNPSNPFMTFKISIPAGPNAQNYVLNIYNIRGQLVRTLAKGYADKPGLVRKVVWDGSNNLGTQVSSGVYFYRLEVGAKIKKGSLVLAR